MFRTRCSILVDPVPNGAHALLSAQWRGWYGGDKSISDSSYLNIYRHITAKIAAAKEIADVRNTEPVPVLVQSWMNGISETPATVSPNV